MSKAPCDHIGEITSVKHAVTPECEECVRVGSKWVHLRTCQECGSTLCCDNSPLRHATAHARSSHHPVVASAEPGERWMYCYPDDAFAEVPGPRLLPTSGGPDTLVSCGHERNVRASRSREGPA